MTCAVVSGSGGLLDSRIVLCKHVPILQDDRRVRHNVRADISHDSIRDINTGTRHTQTQRGWSKYNTSVLNIVHEA